MNEPVMTVVGNLTADPELRTSQAGKPWVTFTVASTPRVKDQSGQWGDGEPLFLGCRVFGELAENVAQSLARGVRVIVQGRLSSRKFTDKNGQERTALDFDVDAIGPELRFATAQVARSGNNRGGGQAQSTWGAPQNQPGQANNSPWGSSTGSDDFGAERPF